MPATSDRMRRRHRAILLESAIAFFVQEFGAQIGHAADFIALFFGEFHCDGKFRNLEFFARAFPGRLEMIRIDAILYSYSQVFGMGEGKRQHAGTESAFIPPASAICHQRARHARNDGAASLFSELLYRAGISRGPDALFRHSAQHGNRELFDAVFLRGWREHVVNDEVRGFRHHLAKLLDAFSRYVT